jgi:hypothetical protein
MFARSVKNEMVRDGTVCPFGRDQTTEPVELLLRRQNDPTRTRQPAPSCRVEVVSNRKTGPPSAEQIEIWSLAPASPQFHDKLGKIQRQVFYSSENNGCLGYFAIFGTTDLTVKVRRHIFARFR